MFSSHITLKDFVRPVPTCQPEVTIETLLALVRSSQHTIIVIVDRQQKPIGALDYHRLLPLVAEHWLDGFTPSVINRFGGAAALAKRDSSAIFTHSLDLNSFKEPIISLSSQMRVQSFLLYLKAQGKTKKISQHYTIVDVRGKLLGLLDVPCLIELYWNWQNSEAIGSQNQSCSHWFFKLLEQTPLPLMLQAIEGQTLYQNRCWREKVSQIKELNQPENTQTSFLQRQQEQHSSVVSGSNWQPPSESYPYCLKDNYSLFSSFPSLSQPTITAHSLKIVSSLTSEVSGDRSNIEGENQDFSRESTTSVTVPTTISSQNIWQYIKLPIDWSDYQGLPSNCSQKCWLIIATPNCQTRQLTQEEAAKDAELSELNRLKDKFLVSISHELKSPLTAIVGLSSLLKEQKLGNLNQRQLRYTELIYSSGRQLMNTVNDLLDWSRLTTGKLELKLEPIEIKTICEEVYQQVIARHRAANKANGVSCSKHQFNLNIEPGLETFVADKLRLCQILTHLLENALKLSAPEGEVEIYISLWTKWVAIIVWSTGKNILEVSQTLVLEPFVQSETSSFESDKELGLVLAQQLARVHGGDISFISRVGIGSEFTLLLPYTQPVPTDEDICEHRSALQHAQTRTGSASKTKAVKHSRDCQNNSLILVVETISHRINNLASQLKKLGYHPIIARTATEALYKARQLKPSKILLDSSILVSGVNILTLLKADSRTTNIPVLLTVEGKQKQKPECGLEGISFADCVDGVLSLPINREILAQVLSPIHKQSCSENKNITILRLYPGAEAMRQHLQSGIAHKSITTENSSGSFGLNNDLYSLPYRVIEADSLEQGEILARIWQLDVILLDGIDIFTEPLKYLHSLKTHESLAALPLVTLDAKTTEAANQVEGLSVFPCLVPAEVRSLADLAQVIQIATAISYQS